MSYISVIKDECGTVVRICSEHSEIDNLIFLENHPEYYRSTEQDFNSEMNYEMDYEQ